VADVLKFLFHKDGYLRELILDFCYLGEDGTGLLSKIVAFYPDLEVLSLRGCFPITADGYCLIQGLTKLSELNLSHCEVYYVCDKLLETQVWKRGRA